MEQCFKILPYFLKITVVFLNKNTQVTVLFLTDFQLLINDQRIGDMKPEGESINRLSY